MRVAREEDKEIILRYLRSGIADCLYIYIDIVNYGIASEHMTVWMEETDGRIELVVMKYYDSFQIYSHMKDCDLQQVSELLQEFPVTDIKVLKNARVKEEKIDESLKALE